MEKNQDLIKKWVTEAGTDLPPAGIATNVLRKIALLPKPTYRPVISSLGWKIILLYIFGISLLSINWNPAKETTQTYLDKLPQFKSPLSYIETINISITKIQLSPQFMIGILIFILFSFLSLWINSKKQEHSI